MKFTQIHPRWKDSRKKYIAKTGFELSIALDKESSERLERLKGRLPKANESEVIALALKSLEEKMGRIIKRKMMRKIRAMKS
jgi:hypothetical protein